LFFIAGQTLRQQLNHQWHLQQQRQQQQQLLQKWLVLSMLVLW
jgi:hypothetical protein